MHGRLSEEAQSAKPERSCLYTGTSVSIENIVLGIPEIDAYFSYFITSMHVHFPLLGTPAPTPDAILRSSPLLFWTTITIACSFQNRPLYRRLQPCVRRLATRTLYPFSCCLETCQALCLLCIWPFEADEPNDDPVFVYAGMATHFALHMGLHRPLHLHEFKNIDSVAESSQSQSIRLLTWYACIFVEHQLASKIGVPSGIRDYHQLQQYLANGDIISSVPLLITEHVRLVCLRERFFIAIAWDGPTSSGLTEPIHRLNLLSLFGHELQRFEAEQAPLQLLTLVLLHASHVAIGGFALAADLIKLKTHHAARKLLIYQAVDSASTILDLVTPLAWETLPTHILRAILHAGILAVQVLRTQIQEKTPDDHDWRTSDRLSPDASTLQRDSSSGTVLSLHRLEQILDRCIGLLQSIAYGKDFSTRGKIVLEAFRHKLHSRAFSSAISSNKKEWSGPLNPVDKGQLPSAAGPTNFHDASEETSPNSVGVHFESRMAANFYWDAVEHEKERHNWNQNEQWILQEVISVLS